MGLTFLQIVLIILGAGVLIGLILLIYSYIEAGLLKVDIRDITPKGAHDPSSTVTIGFFSDSHGKYCHFKPEKVSSIFLENKCDIVLFGGDCCLRKKVADTDKAMLTEVNSALSSKNIPLYAIYGNHDLHLRKEEYSEMGAKLLYDSWEEITIGDAKFALCGLSDSGRDNRVWPTIPQDFSDYPGFRLLLVHNPDFLYSLPDHTGKALSPFDYMLSGHLHGGQVHLPFSLEYRLLRCDKIVLAENILSGEFTFRGFSGFISKGIGCGALPIRFRARPEIHILRFHI